MDECPALPVLRGHHGMDLEPRLPLRQLLEHCLAWIPQPRVALFVLESNEKAIGFYEHMGFRPTGDGGGEPRSGPRAVPDPAEDGGRRDPVGRRQAVPWLVQIQAAGPGGDLPLAALPLGAAAADLRGGAEEILSTRVDVRGTDSKLIGSKLVVKGFLSVSVLYRDPPSPATPVATDRDTWRLMAGYSTRLARVSTFRGPRIL